MARRGRFGNWTRPTFSVSATPIVQQFGQSGIGASASTNPSSSSYASTYGNRQWRANNLTPAEAAKYSIAEEYDLSLPAVNLIFDPGSMNEGNKYAAAGGSDPKTARYPVLLRKPGDRLPTTFEMRNQWAYQADREPIIGEGGQTLDANDPNSWDEFNMAGYIPPRGSAAFNAMKENYSSVGETFDETLSRLGTTGALGQALTEYPTGLKPVTNKEAIPVSSSVVYNPPAYKTVQNPDGTTTTQYLNTSWNGQPSGYSVAAEVATSPNNFPALQGNMIPDDPNFKPTPNPQFWILPNGNTTKSIPGSGSTVGFNTELWQWQTKPEEVGDKTTWELAATNPNTGKIDPLLISRETAAALDKFGNLPQEFKYLLTDSYSIYEPQVAPTAPEPTATPTPSPTPTKTPTPTPPPAPPKKTVETPPPAPTVPQRPTTPSPTPAQPKVPTAPISIPKMTAL